MTMPVMIYDRECPFCLRFQQALEKLMSNNPQITFMPLQERDVYHRYPQLDPQLVAQELHVINEQGQILTGTMAVSYILQLVPLAEKFIWLLDTTSGQKAIDYFYQQVKKRREVLKNRCGPCN